MKERAIFFDRDGTIIVEKDFISDPEAVELIPGAIEALRLAAAEYKLFIVSNQSGVARGLMTLEDVEKVNQRLVELLGRELVAFDGISFCPHHPSITGKCDCRKPSRGMVDLILASHDIDLSRSFVIGDSLIDVELAANIGARAVLVLTGYGRAEAESLDSRRKPHYIAADILDAVRWIKANG